MPSRARSEAGTASTLAVALLGLVLLVAVGGSVVGGLVVAQRQAQAAADLAALAGAVAARDGADPCPAAAGVAADNGAEVTACAVDGGVVTVDVLVPGPSYAGQEFTLRARARAGPDQGRDPEHGASVRPG